MQGQLPFPPECQRGCRCPGCAPEAWRGIDWFAFTAALAKAAEEEGADGGHY